MVSEFWPNALSDALSDLFRTASIDGNASCTPKRFSFTASLRSEDHADVMSIIGGPAYSFFWAAVMNDLLSGTCPLLLSHSDVANLGSLVATHSPRPLQIGRLRKLFNAM